MRISRAAKAIFLIINQVTATVIPPNLRFVGRLTEPDPSSNSPGAPSLVTSRDAALVKPALVLRNLQGGDQGGACKCKVRCASKKKFVDPTKCTRCLPCPPGHVADPKAAFRSCVAENPDPDDKKKKDDKKKDDEEKKKRREEKENKWQQKKKKMNEKFKNKAPDRKARHYQRKIKRLSLCIPIAPLAMGAAFAASVADEFFDEEYIETGEILEHWPEDLEIEEWELDTWNDEDEEKFYQGSFAEGWVKFADETWEADSTVVEVRNAVAMPAPEGQYGAIAVRSSEHHLEKRFFQLIALVLGVAARIGMAVANIATRVAPAVMRIGTRAGRGGRKAKADKAAQGSKVKEMKDKGPLKWCLNKRGPQNHR